jgi:hypothetical protein
MKGETVMLTNDDIQRLRRWVGLAQYMNQEQKEALLDLIRKLKAAEAREGGMPASAVQSMVDVIDDKTMRAIVEEQRHVSQPGWLKQSEPTGEVIRGTGWASPPKVEDRTNQFRIFDAMVAHMAGGPNEPVK